MILGRSIYLIIILFILGEIYPHPHLPWINVKTSKNGIILLEKTLKNLKSDSEKFINVYVFVMEIFKMKLLNNICVWHTLMKMPKF